MIRTPKAICRHPLENTVTITLMLGNNYRDSHAEDPDTQRKVNAMKHKKIFCLQDKKAAKPNLTVKVLKRIHLDMKHDSFAVRGMMKKNRLLSGFQQQYRSVLHVHTEVQILKRENLEK